MRNVECNYQSERMLHVSMFLFSKAYCFNSHKLLFDQPQRCERSSASYFKLTCIIVSLFVTAKSLHKYLSDVGDLVVFGGAQ